MERPSSDELISAYFDDETTPEENVVVDRLLADPKHRQALEEYRQMREELRSMPAPKLDADWSARLKQRLVAAKPEWTVKSDGAAKHAALASALADSPAETPPSGGAMKPMPPAFDPTRGNGYSRFRHLWLTAGVGVAAGTLGIVIGWSAQIRSPGNVAYETGAAAPMTAASPEAIAVSDFEATPALEERSQQASTAGAAPEFAMNQELPDVAANFGSARTGAAPQADEAASTPEPWSGELSGIENAPRMSRSESHLPVPGPPPGVAGVAGSDGGAFKKAEKRLEGARGAMPPVELAAEPSIELSAIPQESEVLEREVLSAGGYATSYATYVGVWNPTNDELSTDQIRGVLRQIDAFGDRARLDTADASGQAIEESLEAKAAPALVLEGSPEHVAEALEVLASDRSRGEVRLLRRVGDAEENSSYERSRRLSQMESRLQRRVASDQRDFQRRKEDLNLDATGEARYAADDKAAPELAFGSATSPIERIEAFFLDDAEAPSALAEGAPSSGMLAGSGFESGGSGGGGFGGIGGGALPSASANGPPPAAMPSIDGPFVETPSADTVAARDPASNVAGRAAPAAAPAMAADLAQSQGEAASEPGFAPKSGPAGAATEAAGVAASGPRIAPAMAGQTAPPAPAPNRADATPPPPAETAASNASGSPGESSAIGKSNRFNEGAPFGTPAMPLARGAPSKGEADTNAIPSDESSPASPIDALKSELEMAEQRLAEESLQEATEFAPAEDRPWLEGKFFAPAPKRVRVILFASERSLPQIPGDRPPSGPAAAIAAPAPAAPATTTPAAEPAPAGAAPATDR